MEIQRIINHQTRQAKRLAQLAITLGEILQIKCKMLKVIINKIISNRQSEINRYKIQIRPSKPMLPVHLTFLNMPISSRNNIKILSHKYQEARILPPYSNLL